MITFKKVLTGISSLFLLLLLIGSFFFVKDYFDKTNKYNQYKIEVKDTIDKNKALIDQINDLLSKQDTYDREKAELQSTINNQKSIIAQKEAQIIKDNQLVIPEDYINLRNNYNDLFDIYNIQKTINTSLQKQVDDDTNQIVDLRKALEDARLVAQQNIKIETNIIDKPVPFIQQYIIGGAGIDIDNEKKIIGGYMIVFRDKISIQIQAQYPLQASLLVGYKL